LTCSGVRGNICAVKAEITAARKRDDNLLFIPATDAEHRKVSDRDITPSLSIRGWLFDWRLPCKYIVVIFVEEID
jgi:hypothetical protein